MTLEAAFVELTGLIDAATSRIGGARTLYDASRDRSAPRRGVYFFLDPAEHRSDGSPRDVRVGTHGLKAASSSTLRQRLSQHRGTISSGRGNHRGSIFRLLVGQALIATGAVGPCPSWGIGSARSTAARLVALPESEIADAECAVESAVTSPAKCCAECGAEFQ